MNQSQGLAFTVFQINSVGGSITFLPESRLVNDSSKQSKVTSKILEKCIGKHSYLELHDFDDHFADITKDWTNQEIKTFF